MPIVLNSFVRICAMRTISMAIRIWHNTSRGLASAYRGSDSDSEHLKSPYNDKWSEHHYCTTHRYVPCQVWYKKFSTPCVKRYGVICRICQGGKNY